MDYQQSRKRSLDKYIQKAQNIDKANQWPDKQIAQGNNGIHAMKEPSLQQQRCQ